jgi:hypothetical protein
VGWKGPSRRTLTAAIAAVVLLVPAIAFAGEPIVTIDDAGNLTWTATGTSNPADPEVTPIYCEGPCKDDYDGWPSQPEGVDYVWLAPKAPCSPRTSEVFPYPALEEGVVLCQRADTVYAPQRSWNCYDYQSSYYMKCVTINSFTATGGAGEDEIEVGTAEGGPELGPVVVSGGGADDIVTIGGYASSFTASGGDQDDFDELRPAAPHDGEQPAPNPIWTVNTQAGTADPSGDAPTISFDGFEKINMVVAGWGDPGHTIIGNADDQILIGSYSNDHITGEGGEDILNGQSGDDTLNGGDKDDLLIADFGSDTLTGGPGVDTFDCGPDTDTGIDIVIDNVPGEELINCEVFQGALSPDAKIRRSSGSKYVGNNIYETTPTKEQTVSWSAKKDQRRTFDVQLENDGSSAAPLTVEGCSGTGKFGVKYFSGSKNITRDVANGTYVTHSLQGGGKATLALKITPKVEDAKFVCDTEVRNAGETDAVRAKLTT